MLFRNRGFISLISVAFLVHLLMLVHDIASQYQSFLWGDRGLDRWQALVGLVQTKPVSYLSYLVEAEVGPGEYIFQLPGYLAGGAAGIIVFQILLSLLAAGCVFKATAILLPWKPAPFICGLLYVLIPQNIVFPHQFVTEAVSTPLCVFFLCLEICSLRRNRLSLALWGGLCFGLAIFVRPSLAIALPPLLLLPTLYSSGHWRKAATRATAICIVASLPMALWVAAFADATGKFGYTSGVANLGWNLRSKVFIVHAGNGLAQPPELERFSNYDQLYNDTAGISVARYLQIVSEHPLLFTKDALVSVGAVLGRGNITKFFVDYLGIARDKNIKKLPMAVLGGGDTAALLTALRGNMDVITMLLLEAVFSAVSLCFIVIAVTFLLFSLIRPRKVTEQIGTVAFRSMLPIASILVAVIASSEIVDAAQARLRNPVEGGLIMLCGLCFFYRRKTRGTGRKLAMNCDLDANP
jgi:4-amino-4-deoxy-L-arabinose transferase-like glycosyltransferase